MTNPCAEPGCPCAAHPTLQRLYAIRAERAANLYDYVRDKHPTDYAALQTLIAAHEAAMGGKNVWGERKAHHG